MDIICEILLFLDPREIRLINREFNQAAQLCDFFNRDFGESSHSYRDWVLMTDNPFLGFCKFNLPIPRKFLPGVFLTACKIGAPVVEYLSIIDPDVRLRSFGVEKYLDICDDYGIVLAARNGHISVVEYLLDYHVERAPLALLASVPHPKIFELILSRINLNNIASDTFTELLQTVVHGGHTAVLRKILSRKTLNISKILMRACELGHQEMVNFLLPMVSDQMVLGICRYNAVMNNHIGIVRRLRKCGIYELPLAMGNPEMINLILDSLQPEHYSSALRLAGHHGDMAMVVRLLGHGPLDTTDAIEQAIRFGHSDVAKLLLSKCPDPSIRQNKFLRLAVKGHVDIVKLLLQDSRIDPSVRNNKPIRTAVQYELDIVELLLQDPRVNPQDALCYAKTSEIVRRLILDPRIQDCTSAILVTDDVEIMNLLLPRIESEYLGDVLVRAVHCGFTDIVKKLLKTNLDLDSINMNMIHDAIINDQFELVHILLQDPRINRQIRDTYLTFTDGVLMTL